MQQEEEKEQKRRQSWCSKILLCLTYIMTQLGRYCIGIYDFVYWLICCKIRKHKDFDSDDKIENPEAKLGIPNYGNTCYLNSILQILASTPGFSNCLNPDTELSGTLLGIINMINRNSEANFRPKIDNFLQIIYQTYSDFKLGRQNDSKEIFTIIIDKCAEINEGLKELFFIKKDKTFICEKGHEYKKEEVNTLLVVPEKFDKGISDFINISEEKSNFSGDNKLYCNTCDALKDTSLYTEYKLPKILVFYFSSGNQKKRNIKDSETFKGKEYELYGVICFYPSYRHYIAYTLDGEIWRKYNDISVSDEMFDYNFIYMAFYRHVEKLEIIK